MLIRILCASLRNVDYSGHNVEGNNENKSPSRGVNSKLLWNSSTANERNTQRIEIDVNNNKL
jgi:hypothetical protein